MTTHIEELTQDREVLKNWLGYCLRQEDWHGVMDAAADIREIEAKIEVLYVDIQIPTAEKTVSYCSNCTCGKAEGCGN
jgi:hypothetical protein